MAIQRITVPDFQYSGIYYQNFANMLREYNRRNITEVTDETPLNPLIQLERSFAMMGHMLSCLLDVVAEGTQLPTVRSLSGLRSILKIIDYDTKLYIPSVAEILGELTPPLVDDATVLLQGSQFSTNSTSDSSSILFEYADEDLKIQHPNELTRVWKYDSSTEVFTDVTTDANDGTPFAMIDPEEGNMLFIGHNELLWNRIDLTIDPITYGSGYVGVWEFYDNDFEDTIPVSVAASSLNIRFDLDSLFGEDDNSGAEVSARFVDTGNSEIAINYYNWIEFNANDVGDFDFADDTLITDSNSASFNFRGAYLDPKNNRVIMAVNNIRGIILVGSTIVLPDTTTAIITEHVQENRIYTGFLGQTSVNLAADKYIIGCRWNRLEIEDTTDDWFRTGYISYNIPKTTNQNWIRTAINSDEDNEEHFFIRYRIVRNIAESLQFDVDAETIVLYHMADVGSTNFDNAEGTAYLDADVINTPVKVEDPFGDTDGARYFSFIGLEYATIPFFEDINLKTNFTIAMWYQYRGIGSPGGENVIIGNIDANDEYGFKVAINTTNNQILFNVANHGIAGQVINTPPIVEDIWYLIGVTYDGHVMRVILNDELVIENNASVDADVRKITKESLDIMEIRTNTDATHPNSVLVKDTSFPLTPADPYIDYNEVYVNGIDTQFDSKYCKISKIVNTSGDLYRIYFKTAFTSTHYVYPVSDIDSKSILTSAEGVLIGRFKSPNKIILYTDPSLVTNVINPSEGDDFVISGAGISSNNGRFKVQTYEPVATAPTFLGPYDIKEITATTIVIEDQYSSLSIGDPLKITGSVSNNGKKIIIANYQQDTPAEDSTITIKTSGVPTGYETSLTPEVPVSATVSLTAPTVTINTNPPSGYDLTILDETNTIATADNIIGLLDIHEYNLITFARHTSGGMQSDMYMDEVHIINEAKSLQYFKEYYQDGLRKIPTMQGISINQGERYALFNVIQGVTIRENIGASSGAVSQSHMIQRSNYIEGTAKVFVTLGDGTQDEYFLKANFLNSVSTSKHFIISDIDIEDRVTIQFGDGVQGKIPSLNSTIYFEARYNAQLDGNVGPNTINNNLSTTLMRSVTNPQSAVGWLPREGYDLADIRRVAVEAPASLRVPGGRAVTTEDVEYIATNNFTSTGGIKPVSRAFAIEEGYGIKTVKLVAVGSGGGLLTQDVLDDLDTYFNGDSEAGIESKMVYNHELTSTNYIQRKISIYAEIRTGGSTLSTSEVNSIRNSLIAALYPASVDSIGRFNWQLGGLISRSKIISIIINSISNPIDVVDTTLEINDLTNDLQLNEDELPYPDLTTVDKIKIVVI